MEHNGFQYNNVNECTQDVYVATWSGKQYHFLKPSPDEICLEDICKALSQINRYGGHTNFPYSVGQHSLLIMEKLGQDGYSKIVQLYGLMHDFSEAYLTDIPTPIKHQLPDYQIMEELCMEAIYKHFGILPPNDLVQQIVKFYDTAILESEVKALCPRAPWTPPALGKEFNIFQADPEFVRRNLRNDLTRLVKYYKQDEWYKDFIV